MSLADPLASQFDRLPPHDIPAEMCYLGALLIDPQSREELLVSVHRDMFFQADHQVIYDVIGDMHRTGKSIDAVTVRAELESRHLLEEIGGVPYLAELIGSVPSAAHGPQYASIIREKALLRQVISISNDLLRDAHAPMTDGGALAVAQRGMDQLLHVATSGQRRAGKHVRDVVMDVLERKQRNDDQRRIPTGLTNLDEITGGIPRGKTTVIGGRSGMGKSQLGKQIALNAARNGVPTAIISIEEDAQKIGENLLSNVGHVVNNHLAFNKLDASEWAKLSQAAGKFKDLPLWVDDTPLQISAVEAAISTQVVKHHVKLIVVDYLQLIDPEDPRAGAREAEVRKMSNALKLLFKRLDVAGVVLAQLNRAGGTDRPSLHHLRESGAIEQDGDLIILLYREDYYRHHEPGRWPTRLLEAIVAKNKDGSPGDAALYFDGAFQRIVDWVPEPKQQQQPDPADDVP
jgi:replicative DNA helicase